MSGVNKAILVGRLGRDPEIRHTESGVPVVNFPIATSETYKDRTTGERKEITEWHNIVLWRGLAEVADKYLHKGDMVYIEGKLRTRSWEKDGVTRYSTEIVGDNMTMLSNKPSDSGPQQGYPQPQDSEPQKITQETASSQMENPSENKPEEDDLPF